MVEEYWPRVSTSVASRRARICERNTALACTMSSEASARPVVMRYPGLLRVFLEQAVDVGQIGFSQFAYGGLEFQLAQDGVVDRLRQVALRGRQLLLGIEHVHRGAHPDFLPELGGFELQRGGAHRLAQRLDLPQPRGHPQ